MFQSASKKEIKRIACGTAILTVAELAFFAVLSMFDMGGFGLRIIVSALIGAVVAIVNFAFLCLMVQRAAGVSDDPGRMKSIVQLSYNLRLAVQAGWIVLAFIVPRQRRNHRISQAGIGPEFMDFGSRDYPLLANPPCR